MHFEPNGINPAACRGQAIPELQYTPEEVQVWGTVLRELQQLYPTHACREFQQNFPLFDFREDRVPQLQDMSQILKCAHIRFVILLGTFIFSCKDSTFL